jgi:hypothetical protein
MHRFLPESASSRSRSAQSAAKAIEIDFSYDIVTRNEHMGRKQSVCFVQVEPDAVTDMGDLAARMRMCRLSLAVCGAVGSVARDRPSATDNS